MRDKYFVVVSDPAEQLSVGSLICAQNAARRAVAHRYNLNGVEVERLGVRYRIYNGWLYRLEDSGNGANMVKTSTQWWAR